MAPDQIAIVRNYAIIARVAGAKDEYEHAVVAVKVLLNQPEYDKLRGILNEAVQFIQNGDLQVGLDLHLLSVRKYPGEALAWYNFGVTLHRCSQIEQAIDFYSRAITLDSRLTTAFLNRGLISVHRSEYELARSDWQAANVCDPKNQYSQIVQILLQDNLVPYVKEHPLLKDSWELLNSPSMLRYVI